MRRTTSSTTLRASASGAWPARLEQRYQIVLCCFLATFSAYVERTGFSIAFTAMAQQSHVDESVKGTVLSAFYWGYGLSQVPTQPTIPHPSIPAGHTSIIPM
jgi:sugar phosphate permease